MKFFCDFLFCQIHINFLIILWFNFSLFFFFYLPTIVKNFLTQKCRELVIFHFYQYYKTKKVKVQMRNCQFISTTASPPLKILFFILSHLYLLCHCVVFTMFAYCSCFHFLFFCLFLFPWEKSAGEIGCPPSDSGQDLQGEQYSYFRWSFWFTCVLLYCHYIYENEFLRSLLYLTVHITYIFQSSTFAKKQQKISKQSFNYFFSW